MGSTVRAPELTATAADSAQPAPVESAGASLGRYRLERELGHGAMGVVHAAFDPDLERLIALKVLRSASAQRDAKDRLLREARAMARLTHPNVVSVYEVGTAAGRDFVAMELIHGETLAAWLAAARRPLAAILEAFVAAGRGLAAAHAAGIVHRDFKPGNVLRSRDGRIAVTDFGLARAARAEPVPPASDDAPSAPSASPITVVGTLLGTPPYMAPEQWNGGAITPATDQFAYCVALWEAITGERPYRGDSREQLRDQILQGPAALDVSRVPRRLRRLLLRGLQPDAAQRWPTMDAVLAQLARAPRRPRTAVVVTVAAGGFAAAVAVIATRTETAAVGCGGDRDVASVWSPAIADKLAVKLPPASINALEARFRDWDAARAEACRNPGTLAVQQWECLNGVLDRFETITRAYPEVPAEAREALQAQLIDPRVCLRPSPAAIPQFRIAATNGAVAAYALLARSQTEQPPSEAEIKVQIEDSANDPCARVVDKLAFATASNHAREANTALDNAASDVDACGDSRLRADLKIYDIPFHWEWPIGGPIAERAITEAQSATNRVMQPELEADLAAARRTLAHQRKQLDEAFRQSDIELAALARRGLPIRQVGAAIARNDLRSGRAEPRDFEAVIADAPRWRPIAEANHRADLAARLELQVAEARYWLGDPAAGAAWSRLWQNQPHPTGPTREIQGKVVDTRGRPVAGATVAVANLMRAASADITSPLSDIEGGLQVATTDNAGRFSIRAPRHTGVIVAALAGRRSKPVALDDHGPLVLQPTRRITGKVALHGMPYTQFSVRCVDADDVTGRFRIVAPLQPDGSFVLDGASTDAVRVGVATRIEPGIDGQVEFQTRPPSRAPITDLQLTLPSSTRVIDVTVISSAATQIAGGQVVVVPGHHRIRSFGDIIQRRFHSRLDQFARFVAPSAGPLGGNGDLVAHLEQVVAGDITVCALGFTSELIYPEVRAHLQDHVTELALKCEMLGADAHQVTIAVPAPNRFGP